MKRVVLIAMVVFGLISAALAAQQKTGTLKGKVEGEKGKPLAGVDVRLMSSRSREIKETTTDASGYYQMELEPDSYTVSFDAEGYAGGTMRDMQQVEEGKTTEVKTIQLTRAKRTSRVSGAVFDTRGVSLAGVRLKLVRVPTEEEVKEHKKIESLSRDYVTNNRGEFAFRLPALRARYRVTAALDGYVTQSKVVDVSESEAVPLAFTLELLKKK
ncbi:MAG TPA: carboxypeptidase-like regulatory domain-containing protein [Blastocatellia bacterium]|nr:carboxypeptidase-like regulatory domain-containing protein [Blastocatellia bacterium]